ncbi:MAG: hypothetical protein JRJ29_11445 [Deltaproteobacteria bacterium]|nr:hypothetical protein [Deltaproteobacteria bacterium]
MRVRSTGLGKTELVLRLEKVARKDRYLLLSLRSTEPVNWHVRILLDRKDFGRLLLLALKGPFFRWLFSIFRKPAAPPNDY